MNRHLQVYFVPGKVFPNYLTRVSTSKRPSKGKHEIAIPKRYVKIEANRCSEFVYSTSFSGNTYMTKCQNFGLTYCAVLYISQVRFGCWWVYFRPSIMTKGLLWYTLVYSQFFLQVQLFDKARQNLGRGFLQLVWFQYQLSSTKYLIVVVVGHVHDMCSDVSSSFIHSRNSVFLASRFCSCGVLVCSDPLSSPTRAFRCDFLSSSSLAVICLSKRWRFCLVRVFTYSFLL